MLIASVLLPHHVFDHQGPTPGLIGIIFDS
jgi:hypothetical protein